MKITLLCLLALFNHYLAYSVPCSVKSRPNLGEKIELVKMPNAKSIHADFMSRLYHFKLNVSKKRKLTKEEYDGLIKIISDYFELPFKANLDCVKLITDHLLNHRFKEECIHDQLIEIFNFYWDYCLFFNTFSEKILNFNINKNEINQKTYFLFIESLLNFFLFLETVELDLIHKIKEPAVNQSKLVELIVMSLVILHESQSPLAAPFIGTLLKNCQNFNMNLFDALERSNRLNVFWDHLIEMVLPGSEWKQLFSIDSSKVRRPQFKKTLIEFVRSNQYKKLEFYLELSKNAICWDSEERILGELLWRTHSNCRDPLYVGVVLLKKGILNALQYPDKKWSDEEMLLLYHYLKYDKLGFFRLGPKISEQLQKLLTHLASKDQESKLTKQVLLKDSKNYEFNLSLLKIINSKFNLDLMKHESFELLLCDRIRRNLNNELQYYLKFIESPYSLRGERCLGQKLIKVALEKPSASILCTLLESGAIPSKKDLVRLSNAPELQEAFEEDVGLLAQLRSQVLELAARNKQMKVVQTLVHQKVQWPLTYLHDPEYKQFLIDLLTSEKISHPLLLFQECVESVYCVGDEELNLIFSNDLLSKALKLEYFEVAGWLLKKGAMLSPEMNFDFYLRDWLQNSEPRILKQYCEWGFGNRLMSCVFEHKQWEKVATLLKVGANPRGIRQLNPSAHDPTGIQSFWEMALLELQTEGVLPLDQQCFQHEWFMAYAEEGSKYFQNHPEWIVQFLPSEVEPEVQNLLQKSRIAYLISLGFDPECSHCLSLVEQEQSTAWFAGCACKENQKKLYHPNCLIASCGCQLSSSSIKPAGVCPVCRKEGFIVFYGEEKTK